MRKKMLRRGLTKRSERGSRGRRLQSRAVATMVWAPWLQCDVWRVKKCSETRRTLSLVSYISTQRCFKVLFTQLLAQIWQVTQYKFSNIDQLFVDLHLCLGNRFTISGGESVCIISVCRSVCPSIIGCCDGDFGTLCSDYIYINWPPCVFCLFVFSVYWDMD